VARRFLSYLQTDFPHLLSLSQLCRDPHLLAWFQSLRDEDPPLSWRTRQLYLLKLRRLLYDTDCDSHSVQPQLILPADIPSRSLRPKLNQPAPSPPHIFQSFFENPLNNVATTVRPGTVRNYRRAVHLFLSFLQTDFPDVLQLSDLRRDPHLFAWFRHLCHRDPSLGANTRQKYLFALRRLLTELTSLGYPVQPGLILREDFPRLPDYLPRALSPEDDQRLQDELRRTDDLSSNALLLTRLTGMRIGECLNLSADCLRSLGQNQFALHVPLGKLYTERFVPADEEIRRIVSRIRALRDCHPGFRSHPSGDRLLQPYSTAEPLRKTLREAAQRAGCSSPVTCHQLRHTFASEMLRLGVSLPALMQLLGHKDIRMTMRYLQITQQDLQREFHFARQAAPHRHVIPQLAAPDPFLAADLSGLQRALRATRHLMSMYRRKLSNEKTRRQLQRLDRRLLDIASYLQLLSTGEK
jgi:site-specific recombinase XerD